MAKVDVETGSQYARKFMELHLQHWPEFAGECEVRPVEDQQ
jgi:hypothetical protein